MDKLTNNQSARVAIIMPVYNAGRFLEVSIASILGQTYQDYRLIAINDGSTDHSVELLQKNKDDRLVIISQQNSGGPAKPRNVGISASDSEYVALFDSDDVMKPDKIALAVKTLDQCPDAAFVFSNFTFIDNEGKIVTDSFLEKYSTFNNLIKSLPKSDDYIYIPPQLLFEGLCEENFIGTSGVVIRRSVLATVGGFDESLKNSDDRDMWFRLSRLYGAAYIPKILHQYRRHSGNISSRNTALNAANRIKVLQRQIEAGVSPVLKKHLLKKIASNYAAMGYAERDRGNKTASAKAFFNAFLVKPSLRSIFAMGKSFFY